MKVRVNRSPWGSCPGSPSGRGRAGAHRGRDPSPLQSPARARTVLSTDERIGDLRCRLQSAFSALLGIAVEHVQTGVPSAGGRLQSKQGARTVQYARAGGVGSGETSRYRHRDVRLGYLLYLIKRSSTCRERVTEVEEAFLVGAGASYVCFSYQMRHHSRAGCSPGLHPDIESELRPRCGSAARQELAHGPDWP